MQGTNNEIYTDDDYSLVHLMKEEQLFCKGCHGNGAIDADCAPGSVACLGKESWGSASDLEAWRNLALIQISFYWTVYNRRTDYKKARTALKLERALKLTISPTQVTALEK